MYKVLAGLLIIAAIGGYIGYVKFELLQCEKAQAVLRAGTAEAVNKAIVTANEALDESRDKHEEEDREAEKTVKSGSRSHFDNVW
jgi:hypothetical protein